MDGVWIGHTHILLRSIRVGQAVQVVIRVAGVQGIVLPFRSSATSLWFLQTHPGPDCLIGIMLSSACTVLHLPTAHRPPLLLLPLGPPHSP